MPKKIGIILVTIGVVLFLSALLLFLYNEYEDRRAGQQTELLMDKIQSAIAEERTPTAKPTDIDEETKTEETATSEPQEVIPTEMPVVVIDGYGYIGYLSVPDLDLELPVMAEWDYSRLKVAPCRQFGSTGTDDLVIAAHNYNSHFGRLSSLKEGAEIVFTDMEGLENRYILKRLDTLNPNAVDSVQNSGYDLVLYTCTPGGATRVTVFCDRIDSAK
ncbi:MAG: sortase [Ruminococcaceae bacterium]|nr:sortase [Oscillospiraceae bacterium]